MKIGDLLLSLQELKERHGDLSIEFVSRRYEFEDESDPEARGSWRERQLGKATLTLSEDKDQLRMVFRS